ncbi:HWE histidine kinase domain-containing protein [Teichococcus coralli]|nr:HWE histidine kinase domain-containing protein [Pseudoroseomonas coralli]
MHLLVFALALLVPALVGGGLTAWQLGRTYRDTAEAGLQGAARAMATAVDRELDVVATAVSTLAGSPDIRSALLAIDQPDINYTLADLHAQMRAVGEAFGGWVVLVRPDGTQLFNTLLAPGTPLPRARGFPWISRAMETGQVVLSDLFTGGVAQRPILAAFAPIFSPGGGAQRELILILAFDPARLADLLAEASEGSVAGLIEVQHGRFVARSAAHAAAVGNDAPAWLAKAVQGRRSGVARGPSLDGTEVVAAYQRLKRVPWAAMVTLPAAAYDAAWGKPLIVLLLAAVALLAAALVLAALLARRLLRPVQGLAREAQAVAAGQPTPPVLPSSPVTEFEALRTALGRAAEGMRARAAAEGRAAAAEEAAAALRTERDRARLYFDVAGAMLVVLDADGTVRGINRRGLEVLGLASEEEALGRNWHDTFVPERLRQPARDVLQALAASHGAWEDTHENRLLRADGEERLIAWRNAVLNDAAGRLLAVVGSGEDITDRRAVEEQQNLLMRELDHRAKNVLAVVQSIVRLTRAERPADFAAAVDGRVRALGRAHTLLARTNWGGSDLGAVIEAELAPYVARRRASFVGPAVRLAPEAVQPLSMILHELATNAAKHGALSRPGGRVGISWSPQPEGGLRLEWMEAGGPPVPPAGARQRGFGSRLIEATALQLGGHVQFDWQPSGLSCQLLIAADRVALQTLASPAGVAKGEPAEGDEQRAPARLEGCRVLVAEDETPVALELEDTLRQLGCTVIGPAATLGEALRLAEQEIRAGGLDAAVLDVNLHGQAAFPVADLLVRHGLPVLFASGYHELPGGWAMGGGQGQTARLHKPLARGALAAALQRLLTGSGDAPGALRHEVRPSSGKRRRTCRSGPSGS